MSWEEIVETHPKVFCAHCGVRDSEHFELSRADIKWLYNHSFVCDRPREALFLVGLTPDGMSWVDFVTRETNGAVTVDGRIGLGGQA